MSRASRPRLERSPRESIRVVVQSSVSSLLAIMAVNYMVDTTYNSAANPHDRRPERALRQLYQNNGNLEFQPVGKQYDVIGIGWAYAPTLADLDNDGFLDIHATTGFISRTRDKPDG